MRCDAATAAWFGLGLAGTQSQGQLEFFLLSQLELLFFRHPFSLHLFALLLPLLLLLLLLVRFLLSKHNGLGVVVVDRREGGGRQIYDSLNRN